MFNNISEMVQTLVWYDDKPCQSRLCQAVLDLAEKFGIDLISSKKKETQTITIEEILAMVDDCRPKPRQNLDSDHFLKSLGVLLATTTDPTERNAIDAWARRRPNQANRSFMLKTPQALRDPGLALTSNTLLIQTKITRPERKDRSRETRLAPHKSQDSEEYSRQHAEKVHKLCAEIKKINKSFVIKPRFMNLVSKVSNLKALQELLMTFLVNTKHPIKDTGFFTGMFNRASVVDAYLRTRYSRNRQSENALIRRILEFDVLKSIAGMQNTKGMIAEGDFERLLQMCSRDGKLQIDLLRAVTGMQAGKGMISENDFARLIRLCSTDGELHMDLLRAITGMQARKGMISQTSFERLIDLCTENGCLHMDLLRSITAMQAGKGMMCDADFDRLRKLCFAGGKVRMDLLRALTRMQVARGMLSNPGYKRLFALCSINGQIEMDLLHAVTGMQAGRGMLSKPDFERLVHLCTVDNVLRTDLLRAVAGMQNGRGMITNTDFGRLRDMCSIDGKLQIDLMCAISRMQHGRGMISDNDFERLRAMCSQHGKLHMDLLRMVIATQADRGMISDADYHEFRFEHFGEEDRRPFEFPDTMNEIQFGGKTISVDSSFGKSANRISPFRWIEQRSQKQIFDDRELNSAQSEDVLEKPVNLIRDSSIMDFKQDDNPKELDWTVKDIDEGSGDQDSAFRIP
jgi:hypothetical protein